MSGGHTFRSERRPQRKQQELHHAYVWKRQTLTQLAEREGRSTKWIKKQIDQAERTEDELVPQSTVVATDTTFWGRHYGVTVFRSPTLKKNLWCAEVGTETPEVYARGYRELKAKGWNIVGAVIDGRRGVTGVFDGIPVQICQFHQVKTVTTYLTRKPKTIAGQELRAITLRLTRSTESEFTTYLDEWYERWKDFLNERTPCSCCKEKRWPYTHRKLRAAYRSLMANLPYLFTYQKYPELNMPNTTNCLDGMFSQLKNRLAVHRGLSRERRYKLIREILKGEDTKSN